MTAYIVFGHGSSLESANDAVRRVAEAAAKQAGWPVYATAFLSMGKPDLATAAGELAARGIEHIVVIPYFLTFGTHLDRDLPALVREILQIHPQLRIDVTAPLDGHPGMVQAVLDRAEEFA
jgi:sirohydrochlorin ferrochelatase